jgi:hypothetical protein
MSSNALNSKKQPEIKRQIAQESTTRVREIEKMKETLM